MRNQCKQDTPEHYVNRGNVYVQIMDIKSDQNNEKMNMRL